MKILVACLLGLGIYSQTPDSLLLTPAQLKAYVASLSRNPLEGVKAFDVAVWLPEGQDGEPFKKRIKDAIELELLRSGIKVVEKQDYKKAIANKQKPIFAEANIVLDVFGMDLKYKDGTKSGRCDCVGFKATTGGFSDDWKSFGTLTLYEDRVMLSGSEFSEDRMVEEATSLARAFCLEWMKRNPK